MATYIEMLAELGGVMGALRQDGTGLDTADPLPLLEGIESVLKDAREAMDNLGCREGVERYADYIALVSKMDNSFEDASVTLLDVLHHFHVVGFPEDEYPIVGGAVEGMQGFCDIMDDWARQMLDEPVGTTIISDVSDDVAEAVAETDRITWERLDPLVEAVLPRVEHLRRALAEQLAGIGDAA